MLKKSLKALEYPGYPQLEVWNKVDLIDADDRDALGKIAERNDHILTISAITGHGLDNWSPVCQRI